MSKRSVHINLRHILWLLSIPLVVVLVLANAPILSDSTTTDCVLHGHTTGMNTISAQKAIMLQDQIVGFMQLHANRAYFSRLFKYASFRRGMEVGVASGRFSEHFLRDLQNISSFEWTMIEPFPNDELLERYNPRSGKGKWELQGLLDGVKHNFYNASSLDEMLLKQLPNESFDFIYLDGDHSYEGVKKEMFEYWPKVKKGGMLAGHDYCNLGEPSLLCSGCSFVPKCLPYTEYGFANGKTNSPLGAAANQNEVVKAVQEWTVEEKDPRLTLRYTREDFTRESLAHDNMDYDLIITNTRTPSWYIMKPV